MLNKKEISQLQKLLSKIKYPELREEVFEALVKVVPFVACELVIVNNKKELLLTYREDEYWQGWHFPGGLMRFNDSFAKRIREVAKNELGIRVKDYKFLFPMNYTHSPRGHAVGLVFICITKDKPKDGRFFATMPKAIIKGHREVWKKVRKSI